MLHGLGSSVSGYREDQKTHRHLPHLPFSSCARQRHILRKVQREHYVTELKTLLHGEPLSQMITVYTLEQWLDKEGLLRVGGHLSVGSLKNRDSPILLPREHSLMELII